MCLLRVITQGRLSELLAADDATLRIDTFMRKNGFYTHAKKAVDAGIVGAKSMALLEAYSEGVNRYLAVCDRLMVKN